MKASNHNVATVAIARKCNCTLITNRIPEDGRSRGVVGGGGGGGVQGPFAGLLKADPPLSKRIKQRELKGAWL
jgi:hypothetical protein